MHADTDYVTILSARSTETWTPILTKRISRGADGTVRKTNFDRPKNFDAETRTFDNLEGFAALLGELQGEPGKCIIRGRLKDGDTAQGIRRCLDKPGKPGTIVGGKHCLLLLDLDDVELPPHIDAREEPEAALTYLVCTRLPAEFHGAAFVWQWSSGAGLGGWSRARAHLGFMLDRTLADKTLHD
jgi:hypothetical protein